MRWRSSGGHGGTCQTRENRWKVHRQGLLVHGLLFSNGRRSLTTQARKARQGGARGQRSRLRRTVCRWSR